MWLSNDKIYKSSFTSAKNYFSLEVRSYFQLKTFSIFSMASDVGERWQTKIKSLSEGVNHIFGSGEFADVTFLVRGQSFKAHKLILASRSSEFSRLLMSANAPDEIVIDRASPVTVNGFQSLLRFIYTNELNASDKNSIVEAYQCAKYFSQKALQNKCIDEIESWEIDADDVCNLLSLTWDVPSVLKDKCISFIRSNGRQVISSEAFTNASDKAVTDILSSGALTHVPILERIECVMNWGKNKFGSDYSLVRQRLLEAQPPLMGVLEIEKLLIDDLSKILKNYPKLLTNEEVANFVLFFGNRDNPAVLPSWCKLKMSDKAAEK